MRLKHLNDSIVARKEGCLLRFTEHNMADNNANGHATSNGGEWANNKILRINTMISGLKDQLNGGQRGLDYKLIS